MALGSGAAIEEVGGARASCVYLSLGNPGGNDPMKHLSLSRPNRKCHPRKGARQGYIMLALLVIVALMLFYIAASSRTLYQLQREITALERTQVKRLANSPAAANPTARQLTNAAAPAVTSPR